MSDTYRSEAEALADALPPPSQDRCTNHPERPGRWEFEDGYKCDECRQGFRLPGGESTSAALARAEAERDKAIRERDSLARRCALRFEETEKLRGELIRAGQEIERLRGNETRWAAEVEHAEAENERLRTRIHEAVDDCQRRYAAYQSRCDTFDRWSAWARERFEREGSRYWLMTSEANRLVILSIIAERDTARAELASARESLDARNRALVRARADLDEARQDVEIERTEVANLRRVQTDRDALREQLVRARAEIAWLIGQARYGTTLCPRCGVELAAEVDAEKESGS